MKQTKIKRHGWSQPPEGVIKLNVDAAFHQDTGTGGTGAVLRDEAGFFVAAFCSDIPFVEDASTTEARGLRDGLLLANEVGCNKIYVKADCDVEYPTVIPMDLSSSHEVLRGPMTRARARALETEVTSLLSDITYDPIETWLLPKSEMLCTIRYQEDPPEDAREDGQAAKFTDEENQRKESRTTPRPRTSGP